MTRASSRIPLRGIGLRLPVRPIVYGVGLGAAIVAFEKLGRASPHDGVDLLGILGVLAIVRITALVPASFVPWRENLVGWLRVRVLELRSHLRHNVGIDLRGDVRTEGRPVPLFRTASGVGWVLLAVVLALRGYFPDRARELLLSGSATVYYVFLSALWGMLLLGIAVSVVVSFILIHDLLVRRRIASARGRSRLTILLTALYFASMLGVGHLVGYGWGIWLGAVALLLAHMFPKRPEGKPLIALVKNRRGEVFSVPFSSFVRQANTWVCQGVIALGLVAGGGAYPGSGQTEFTLALGACFLWVAAPLLVTVLARGLHLFWGQPFLSSPSGARLKTVWLLATEEGLAAQVDLPTIERRLRVAEWAIVCSPSSPPTNSADLVLELSDSPETFACQELPGDTPVIQVRSKELAELDFPKRLDRWDHVWKRRRLYRRLRRLFKIASTRVFEKGTGFLFAPHYWFVVGLTRDEDEDGLSFEDTSDGCIGPPYREVFGVRLRRYLRELFESLEVDVIFIEDGVGYRGLKRVLSVMFEIYDVHGGRARAEDRHFMGLPGLNVHVDDFGLDRERHPIPGYPEPEYEGIGRARVLVIQKERGGGDEEVPPVPPVDEEEDWNWLRDALQGIAPRSPVVRSLS
ncbi:MAG: hypothetical protein AB7O52_18415 [Planctomycetota bacterium]